MYKVLLADPLEEVGIKILEKECEVTKAFDIDKAGLLKIIEDYDAVLVRVNTPIDKEIIDKAKKLKVIGMPGAGLNHIDVEYAKKKNIKVYNVPGGNMDSVAELTFAHILALSRRIYAASKKVKEEGCWNKYLFMGNELSGKTIGIIGVGKIGLRVAEIARAFKMQVVAYDPYVTQDALPDDIRLMTLDELFATADIITIHVPLTKETYHLISYDQIKKMKDGAYIVNMSRGGVLDEEAAYEALKNGKLAGVGCDVLEDEPPPEKPVKHIKLFDLDNFLITPHLGAWTVEAQNRVAEIIAQKMLEGLKNN